MSKYCYVFHYENHYKGQELSTVDMDCQERAETTFAPQPLTAIEAKLGNTEAASEEREKQLELWMKDIEMFIRRIDVNKL
ncbi:MAG: hypothetical protein AB2L11_05000 [Syntrophobacteraceae bacterium]